MHVLYRWKLDCDLPGPEEVLRGGQEDRKKWLSSWSCSCQLAAATTPATNLVVFIYSEAEEALRRGFPFAAALAQPLADDHQSTTNLLRGPLRREDAQRRQAEEQQLHQLLLRHVQHHRSALEQDDGDVQVCYARKVLRFPLPPRQQRGEVVEAGGDVVVFVREDHGIVPHGQVWEGSVEMARWICAHYHERFRTGSSLPPRVLELGSGCGLPGLVLAALGAQVTLSDRSEGALNNLVHNVGVNMSAFTGSSPPAVVHLDWAEPGIMRPVSPPTVVGESPTDPRGFDFIVGTEVVYSEEGAEHLINTVKVWLPKDYGGNVGHDLGHDAARPSFYLLQNPLRAGLQHFVGLLAGTDRQLADDKEELSRALALEELRRPSPLPAAGPPLAQEPGETEEQLRLYRVTRRV